MLLPLWYCSRPPELFPDSLLGGSRQWKEHCPRRRTHRCPDSLPLRCWGGSVSTGFGDRRPIHLCSSVLGHSKHLGPPAELSGEGVQMLEILMMESGPEERQEMGCLSSTHSVDVIPKSRVSPAFTPADLSVMLGGSGPGRGAWVGKDASGRRRDSLRATVSGPVPYAGQGSICMARAPVFSRPFPFPMPGTPPPPC